jgi:hypothetical protein
MLAIGNLQNLIAAEVDPYLIWMHAVTLSSIDSNRGSAIDIINATPHNPILWRTLHLDGSRPWPITRSVNERAISETTLSNAEYQDLSQRLRLRNWGDPADAPGFANYASPAPTRTQGDGREVAGQFVLPGQVERPGNPFLVWPPPHPPEPPPPPQRIPAHPLIAQRRFEDILKQMDAGSMEAWQLSYWYGEEFPPGLIANRYVPLAFNKDPAVRERAMFVLKRSGPDAELAAVLINGLNQDFNLRDRLDLIERIPIPGAYTQDVLDRICLHKNPSVRSVVIEAMARAPEMDQVLLETLRVSLSDDDLEIRHAALRAILKSKNPKARTQAWLKDVLLNETQLEILEAAVKGLKGQPLPAEFQRQVFGRIDIEKPAEFNLVLIDCLLDQTAANSDAGKKLLQLQQEMQALYIKQTQAYLVREVRWMIQESSTISQQSQRESLEQLKKLSILD